MTHQMHLERFVNQGKTETDYRRWSTEVGQRMHINGLDKLICERFNLYTVAHLVYLPTSMPAGIEVHEVNAFLIAESENPLELARLWKHYTAEAQAWICPESILAERLDPFPKTDFERFGDPNHLPDVSRTWFKKDGVNLDVQIQQMNDWDGETVSIQAAIEFVMQYKPNTYQNPMAIEVKRIEERFKTVTGFKLKDYYAEHLIRMSCYEKGESAENVPF